MLIELSENEIRPDHLRQVQAQLFAADVERLVLRKAEFVPVPCPACGGDAVTEVWCKYGLTFPLCSACGSMYMSPRPTPALLKEFYSTSENYRYWNRHIFPASEEVRRLKMFRPRAERIASIAESHGIRLGTLVDVGAGFGTFCEEAIRTAAFCSVIAVEPTPDLAETCKAKGLRVFAQPIEDIQFKAENINIITSFEVIEHLFSPRDFVAQCFRLLSPGGLLILTCPNGKGFEIEMLRELSGTMDAEHLNYFNPDSLSRLVTDCGLSVLETFTPGRLDAELVRKQAQAGTLDLGKQPLLRRVLLEEWERVGKLFQDFISEAGLSSHMWLVAQKA